MAKSKNKQSGNANIHSGIDKALEAQIMALEPIKNTDSSEVIKQKLESTSQVLNKLMTFDAFQNQMARIGFNTPSLNEGAQYPMTRMSYSFNLFQSMYRSSWIVRKIVDVVPSDMVKNWIKIKSGIEPDKITKLEAVIRKTKTKDKIKECLKWARLFGGAAALILIDGQDDCLDEPLDYDTIMPGQYKGLLVFDRWSGIYPLTTELVNDINDPEFGQPEYYDISTSQKLVGNKLEYDKTKSTKVHHSRILKFTGRSLPYWETIFEQYWGESEVEIVYEELKKRDNTSYNIANLIFLANIRVLKMNDLGQLLGAGTRQAQTNLWNVLESQNQIMSNMGIYVMDKDDDFSTHQSSFSGLNDIYESFMLDVAGACEMPVTKLFGRAPAGFNSTGESDLKQYYDSVKEKQSSILEPQLDKLIPIICMSTLGAYPEDLTWEFNPVMSVDNKDTADLAKSFTDIIMEPFNAGIVDKATALRELKQQSEITGIWTNITDKMIENAMDEEKQEGYSNEEQDELENEIAPESNKQASNEQNINSQQLAKLGEEKLSKDTIGPQSKFQQFLNFWGRKYQG